ncbi:hypothetical protein TSUD_198580 [Trifolium subterraneum]|uniref:Helitron helicase-like domain-containing protein n=1 Tax=Trifolium subterraneum TaxID=3900 RepID=A0A2Z6MLS5_TRISU|nr:hypothetical protein TSUD_198580 [Trifolium subterraneum]
MIRELLDFGKPGFEQTYMDLGCPDFLCQKCGSTMWYEERANKPSRPETPEFSICCLQGKVVLDFLKQPPEYLKELLDYRGGMRSIKFRENIRAYNSIFAFTSMGAKIDRAVNFRPGSYVYKISGQNYHRIGGLIPSDGKPPKFAQLYVYDTENEIHNRLSSLKSGDSAKNLDATIVQGIKDMLDVYNRVARVFRMARDRLSAPDNKEVHIKLIGTRSDSSRQYTMPTTSEIAALIVRDFGQSSGRRDIVVEQREMVYKE